MQIVNYYRFCCRIRIADENADEVPGGEFLAVEYADVSERHEQFAHARINEDTDWFSETPPLLAHIRALQQGRDLDVRSRLVDTEAAMLYVGATRESLYRWRRAGQLSWHKRKLGGRWYAMWDPLELETFLDGGARRERIREGMSEKKS